MIVPSVVSGDFQVGFSNATSLLIAASEGLPLEIIAQGVRRWRQAKEGVAWDGVLVTKDSAIKSRPTSRARRSPSTRSTTSGR